MTIFRVQKKENYVVLDKGFLNDKSLSWQAKGLLAYMLSLPNDWCFSITDLTNRSKNGRDATNNIVKELVQQGYIQKEQKRSNGRFDKTELLVFEIPNAIPFTENPSTEKSLMKNPSTEKPSLISNKILNNKKTNNVEPLNIVHQIIEYLNAKSSKNYKATTVDTKRLINDRLAEGYKLEDFKRVIDVKTKEWLYNPDMNKYLRPNTLFNEKKFEGYLNEALVIQNKQIQPSSQPQPPVLDFCAGEDFR